MGKLLFTVFWGLHLTPFVAIGIYFAAERSRRSAYHVFALPPIHVVDAPYRSPRPVDAGHLERAPKVIRAAAFASIVMGSAFVPGLAWGLLGLLALGLGLVSIPGLVIAAWLWKAGFGLLGGSREAARSAMRASRLSFWFNVILVPVAIVAAFVWNDLAGLAAMTGLYALVSIGQATLLAKAAVTLGRLHDADLGELLAAKVPTPVRRIVEWAPAQRSRPAEGSSPARSNYARDAHFRAVR